MFQSRGLKRDTIDKYYTKESIANVCIDYIRQYLYIDADKDLIIEPSAGNGSFITGIKTLTSNHIFFDLEPQHSEIIQQDYLLYNGNDGKSKKNRVHVIGNPPFGRQSSMAIKFIKKSCEFCDSISFILPKSFKKDSLRKVFPLNLHLLFEIDIPEKSFIVNGIEHDVPCVFQIWEKKPYDRPPINQLEPQHFMFVTKSQSPHIAVRRVGVYAGNICDKDIEKCSETSHYFIRFLNNMSILDNIARLSNVTYDVDNTVGPKSISKQELISRFNPLLS